MDSDTHFYERRSITDGRDESKTLNKEEKNCRKKNNNIINKTRVKRGR